MTKKQISFYPKYFEVKAFLHKNKTASPTPLMNGLIKGVQHIFTADAPVLSDCEHETIIKCLSGVSLNATGIEHLHNKINDTELALKIKCMSIGVRYALLDSLGLLKWDVL